MIDGHKYEGRQFTGVGKQDCLKLVIDLFLEEFDIVIPNFARPHDWRSDELDLVPMLAPVAGFKTITEWTVKDLRPGDVLCIAFGESRPNHLAVYTGEGDMVHHLIGRFSNQEVYRDIWRSRTSYILRHPDVPDLRPVYPDVHLEDYLRERNSITPTVSGPDNSVEPN